MTDAQVIHIAEKCLEGCGVNVFLASGVYFRLSDLSELAEGEPVEGFHGTRVLSPSELNKMIVAAKYELSHRVATALAV